MLSRVCDNDEDKLFFWKRSRTLEIPTTWLVASLLLVGHDHSLPKSLAISLSKLNGSSPIERLVFLNDSFLYNRLSSGLRAFFSANGRSWRSRDISSYNDICLNLCSKTKNTITYGQKDMNKSSTLMEQLFRLVLV